MSNTTYLDEFIDKMYLVPNDINRHLRLIRTLDKRAQIVQQYLNQAQGKFLNQIKQYKQSSNGTLNGSSNNNNKKQMNGVGNNNQIPPALKADYEKIVTKQKQLYGYFRQKYQISQQLKVMVAQYYEQLDTQLKSKLKQKTEEQKQVFLNRKKFAGKFVQSNVVNTVQATGPANLGNKLGTTTGSNGYANNTTGLNNQFMYDMKQPAYCYCGGGSFGEMVMCQNPYCERQWFHADCLDEKNLPQKWYCSQCQKQKQKTRNPHSRSFFINKQT